MAERDVRALASAVGVELVKDQKGEIRVNGVADRAFLHARQEQLKHHVVGQQDLGRVLAQFFAGVFVLLPGVLAEGDREFLPCVFFVVVLIGFELDGLRVDQRVHRIDDDGGHAF